LRLAAALHACDTGRGRHEERHLQGTGWLHQAKFLNGLDAAALAALEKLTPAFVEKRTVLFRPGDMPAGFVLVLSGRIGVYLIGKSGRELLLYAVTPGETCVQTTLGILGGEPYGGEAVAETDLVAVTVPLSLFSTLMDTSPAFRGYVFRAFAGRLNDVVRMLERVAFVTVERRLARALIERAGAGTEIAATHQELAIQIGTAREVVTRRLEAMADKDLIHLERGQIAITDAARLARLAAGE
jgi:CRP/FNR family transcriptional regulator